MWSRESVTLAMALTTTTGFLGRRSLTMAATRSMAVESCTDVPPNFITIIGGSSSGGYWYLTRQFLTGCLRNDFGWKRLASPQISLRLQQFSIEQGRSGCTSNRVMREHGELPVEYWAWAQTPNGCGHSGAAIGIEARLRTITGAHVLHRFFGSAWQFQLLRFSLVAGPCRQNLIGSHFLLQLHRDRFRVPIFYGDAVALRAHGKAGRYDLRAIHVAKQFERLLLHLFFFFGDVGNDIAENVERSDARISCATDRLHRDRHHRLKPELLVQWSECQHQSDR